MVANGGTLQVDSGATVSRTVTRIIPGGAGRVGGTAGFGSTDDGGAATCPASQTAATWIIPIPWLKVGDTINSYELHGQLESAANQVTVDCDLRKITSGTAADPVDASIGAITQVDKTADYLIAESKTLASAEVIASTEAIYALITVTTGASTDVYITSLELNITEA